MTLRDSLYAVFLSLCAGGIGGILAGWYAAEVTLTAVNQNAQRVEVKATFDAPDQAIVEFPAVVHGRIVRCTVYANTKRRVSAVCAERSSCANPINPSPA